MFSQHWAWALLIMKICLTLEKMPKLWRKYAVPVRLQLEGYVVSPVLNPRSQVYLMSHWTSGKWDRLSNFGLLNASSTSSSSSVYYFNLNSFTFFGEKGQGDPQRTGGCGGKTAHKQKKTIQGIVTEPLHLFIFSISNFKCTHFPAKDFQMLL